jgi:lipopolysaccharide export system permease protein
LGGTVCLRKDAETGGRQLGILQRYVIGEVVRSFGLALLTMTIIFVLFMVAAQARDIGLSPSDVAHLVPYVIPSTLPYTVPVSLLFAATVVYGRLAGDNEIIAIKTAGLSVWCVLRPTVMFAAVLSGLLLYVSGGWIPRCTHAAKMVLFHDLEDMFYKMLARDREFNHPKWPFLIKVRDVEGTKMLGAIFKHKVKGGTDYDATIVAEKAEMHFFLKDKLVRVDLENSESQHSVGAGDGMIIKDDVLEIPIPPDTQFIVEKKIQEYTNADIAVELRKTRKLVETVRRQEAIKASFAFATGRISAVNWADLVQAFRNHGVWISRCHELETEWHLRISMAFGSLLFVILGAPVGILFARRDFLSAFMTCFLPIIGVYYPLMLMGVNMSKEGMVGPIVSLWIGNLLLAVGAGFVLPSVVKH